MSGGRKWWNYRYNLVCIDENNYYNMIKQMAFGSDSYLHSQYDFVMPI